jgi:hypothetical protein
MTPENRKRLDQMWRELGCDPTSDDCARIEALVVLDTLEDIRQGFDRLKKDFERSHGMAVQTRFSFSGDMAGSPPSQGPSF